MPCGHRGLDAEARDPEQLITVAERLANPAQLSLLIIKAGQVAIYESTTEPREQHAYVDGAYFCRACGRPLVTPATSQECSTHNQT